MDATVTWALPVKADRFGAHLQAYVETLHTIITLRLCNRFGRGTNAVVQKLPVELVKMIERLLFQKACKETLPGWQLDFKCLEHECVGELVAHMTEEEKHDMLRFTEPELLEEWLEEEGVDYSSLTTEMIDKFLNAEGNFNMVNYENEVEAHDERKCSWSNRAVIFDKHRELLNKTFGVDVWTSQVRLDLREYDRFQGDEAANTTVTYLVLPARAQREFQWTTTESEEEWGLDAGSVQSGYGVPIDLGEPPSAASLKRFQRTVEILDLQVFVHPTQAGRPVGPEPKGGEIQGGGDRAGKRMAKVWSAEGRPQLTLLLRGTKGY